MNAMIVLTGLLSLAASAGEPDYKAIYQHLDVNVTNVTPEGVLGSQTNRKEAGGLICDEVSAVVPKPKPSYNCTLKSGPKGDAEIYGALKLEQKNVTPEGVLGSATFEKRIGALRCTKTSAVVPNPKPRYSCSLEEAAQMDEDASEGGNSAQ